MGRAKEEILKKEENAKHYANLHGDVCACGQPFLTSWERYERLCSHCSHTVNKDD